MIEAIDFSSQTFLLIILCAFATGILHGATGMAGGIIMAAMLSNLISVKTAIPLMTIALVFSHSSRVIIYLKDIDWQVVKTVLLFSVPTIVFGAIIFTYLSAQVVCLIMAGFLIVSFPIKAYARKHDLQTTTPVLAGASSVWGLLAGNVIGPGFFLAPFLLGTGMNRLTFVGSLAMIVLIMNVTKLLVFGASSIIDVQMLLMGICIGLATIPGNILGREILKRTSDAKHQTAVNVMTVIIIINFIYLSFN